MLTIIGCGNPVRRDDGVGVAVVRRIAERLAAHPVRGVQAFDCGTAGFEVMYRARGSEALVVVDASRTGAPAGTVHEVPGEVLASLELPPVDLHAFRWDHAIALGRKLDGDAFPSDVQVFLVEAADLEFGEGLTEAVAQAAELVHRRLLDRIAAHAAAQSEAAIEPALTLVAERGNLQVPCTLYERLFAGRTGAAVLHREGALVVLPIAAEDGGLLVKQRNLAGDRSIEIRDVLRSSGWDELGTITFTATADPVLGGLVLVPSASTSIASTP
ncbi:MAG: hydrogenase maturation protease [Deltaproteobacteria bacterium]|nr:hydrogenase maturation protease [Deltaproteobacteria bacterium]